MSLKVFKGQIVSDKMVKTVVVSVEMPKDIRCTARL